MSDRKERIRLFRVGVMTATTLLVMAALVVSIGATQGAFTRKVTYITYFKSIGGLSDGAPVKLAGVPIGSVTEISFPDDLTRTDIRIELSVAKRKAKRIRGGTKAQLLSLSLLSGEKYIELTPGDPSKPEIPAGSTILVDERGGGIEQIGGAATDVAAEIVKIADSLNKVLKSINEGQGLLGKAVNDPDFGQKTLDAVQGSLERIRDMLDDLREGKSTAGRVLFDRAYGERLTAQLESATTSLNSILSKMDRGEGTAGQIVNDTESGKAIVTNLRDATQSLKEVLDEVKNGQGLASKLIYDKEYGDKVSADLASSIENLRRITEKLDRGEGTAAKVLNDPGIYTSLHDIVSGVEKSKIAGAVLRHYQKKGIKNRARAAAEEVGPEAAQEKLEEAYGEPLGEP